MEKKTNNKLKIGFSIGDYNGIGPEILLKTFSKYNLFEKCIPIVFCSKEVLNYYKDDNELLGRFLNKDLKSLGY